MMSTKKKSLALVNQKKKKKKRPQTRVLKFKKITKRTEAEIIRFWKKYAKRLSDTMTEGVTLDDPKLNFATWTQEDIDYLTTLIDRSHKELTLKFVKQTKGIKFDKDYDIQTVSLKKIKDNKKIYDAFADRRDEHIRYFKEFPKKVKGRTQKHLDDIIEFLDESKKSVTFDAQKLANTINMTEGMSRRHANFIAKDQLNKFVGSINEAQAKFIGADEYVWRTLKDHRVRHEHVEREGKVFKYSKPPEGGNPTEDYGCRCYAEAIVKIEGYDD